MKALLAMILLTMMLCLAAGQANADCKDTKVKCWGKHADTGEHTIPCGEITVGACYTLKWGQCIPCAEANQENFCGYKSNCNSAFPNCCDGNCWVSWKGFMGLNKLACGKGGWQPPSY